MPFTSVQDDLGDPAYLSGSQVQPDRTERKAERAAQPLRVTDAERGEQSRKEEVP